MKRVILSGLVGAQLLTTAVAQTWCGKHYMSTQSVVAPGGNFQPPAASKDPLLAFRCAPAIRPYLAEDVSSPAAVLIDSPVVYYEIANAKPIDLAAGPLSTQTLDVTISLNGKTLDQRPVPLNATAYELSFSLEDVTPQMAAYNVSCEATYTGSASTSQTFSATTALSFLPNPTNSSVTKMDLRTGGLLAKPATGLGGAYEPVFPIGFYTMFDDYLATNLSVIDELKEQGFTIIHPVPTFDNMTAFNMVVDRMQEVGLYLMYDMRFTYMNTTSVIEQVNSLKNRPNLLLLIPLMQPPSPTISSTAWTVIIPSAWCSTAKITTGHHTPLALDVVMQDVYMVGNNVTHSNEWNTPCDTTAVQPNSTLPAGYVPANSGIGTYFDISDRVASFKNRLEVMGWERTKAVWTVPQAFGGENIKASASAFAMSLPKITPFLFDPAAVRTTYVVGGASVATWGAGSQTLVLATNTNYINQTVQWEALGLEGDGTTTVFTSGIAETSQDGFMLGSVGSGAFVVTALRRVLRFTVTWDLQ
ncbi:hypothetical protein BU15DRAFT_61981 [Melanogaster broomeanus]|nr:hypothetical protein BU15DRAFT_61981 [Melanogaster broomeanus]